MNWEKSSDELAALFDAVLPQHPAVEKKKMFGYPCAFVNGNMYAGLHRQNMMVRLDEKTRLEWIHGKGATRFEPMPGRPMKEYINIPADVLANRSQLSELLEKSLTFVLSLQPKEKAAPKRKTRH